MKSTGQKLWEEALKVIPGGNSLLSKRPDLFAPEVWPTYFKSCKGVNVIDLDNKEYIDMSIMGIGTNVLGYGNNSVDAAVSHVIKQGNMSTLNSSEEVALAKRLVEMHPWADMARFARGGGEANSIAIRIARAFSKKYKVAFCGYHGWHDWYMAAGKDKDGLSGHIFSDTKTDGVPEILKGTNLPFEWNNLQSLKDLIIDNKDEIGVVKMEVTRNVLPKKGFLEGVRQVCNEENIVLIFDECTSGFRETFGGLHLKYEVNPDMAVFGKALGNGYAISAVIGREEIMRSAQNTFISSTFWTERIGYSAALAAINEMENIKSWEIITDLGTKIQKKWKEIADKKEVKISLGVLPAIASFSFESKNANEYKTYLTREFLKKGYLASNLLFVSTEHLKINFDEYFYIFEVILEEISKREKGIITSPLVSENLLSANTFKRLN